MSFLENTFTLTRYPLSTSTRRPPATTLLNFLHRSNTVRVELHDPTSHHHEVVATVSAGLLHIYTPHLLHRIEQDPRSQEWTLRICIHSLDHAADIENPALRWLFQQMHGIAPHHRNWNCVPAHTSIGQGVLLYRALQLLQLDDAAQTLRPRLMQELQTKALTAYDVQRLWWTFQYTNEWAEWLDALLANLAYFNVYNLLVEGSYIRDFMEAEMANLGSAEQAHIERVYWGHREAFRRQGYVGKMRDWVKWALGIKRWGDWGSDFGVRRD